MTFDAEIFGIVGSNYIVGKSSIAIAGSVECKFFHKAIIPKKNLEKLGYCVHEDDLTLIEPAPKCPKCQPKK